MAYNESRCVHSMQLMYEAILRLYSVLAKWSLWIQREQFWSRRPTDPLRHSYQVFKCCQRIRLEDWELLYFLWRCTMMFTAISCRKLEQLLHANTISWHDALKFQSSRCLLNSNHLPIIFSSSQSRSLKYKLSLTRISDFPELASASDGFLFLHQRKSP